MDLTVETKQYKFTASYDIACIEIFLANKTKKSPDFDSHYYLTKEEVQELIEYLNKKYTEGHWLVNRLSNMEILMEGKEKASFYFW